MNAAEQALAQKHGVTIVEEPNGFRIEGPPDARNAFLLERKDLRPDQPQVSENSAVAREARVAALLEGAAKAFGDVNLQTKGRVQAIARYVKAWMELDAFKPGQEEQGLSADGSLWSPASRTFMASRAASRQAVEKSVAVPVSHTEIEFDRQCVQTAPEGDDDMAETAKVTQVKMRATYERASRKVTVEVEASGEQARPEIQLAEVKPPPAFCIDPRVLCIDLKLEVGGGNPVQTWVVSKTFDSAPELVVLLCEGHVLHVKAVDKVDKLLMRTLLSDG